MKIACQKGGIARGGSMINGYKRSSFWYHQYTPIIWKVNAREMATKTEIFLSPCRNQQILWLKICNKEEDISNITAWLVPFHRKISNTFRHRPIYSDLLDVTQQNKETKITKGENTKREQYISSDERWKWNLRPYRQRRGDSSKQNRPKNGFDDIYLHNSLSFSE